MSFIFTQTSIKDFENPSTCPFRWKSQWLDGQIPFKSSEDLDKGKYFEWLAIGGSAKDDDVTTDLTRLANGKKSTDQLRIEAQAARCKRMLYEPSDPEWLGFSVTDVQVKLQSEDGSRQGTLDIIALDKNGIPWVIDLKLTRDATNDRSPYGWGNNWEELDLLQQIHYESLYEDKYKVKPKMGLLVFDYSPSKRVVFGEISISERRRIEKEIRFKAAEEAKALYDEHGWIKLPSLKECEECPLKCDKRELGSKLVRKQISY